jgi:flagellar protein FlaG
MEIGAAQSAAQALPAVAPTIPAEQAAQNRQVVQAVKAVNNTEMFGQDRELEFQKDAATNRMVVRVIDRKTKEVLSQVPPEYLLRLAQDLGSKSG